MGNFTLRERHNLKAVGIELGIVAILFVVVSLIGPFGTFNELPLSQRLVYWGFMTFVNWLQLRLLQAALASFLGWDRFWAITLGACVLASVPATFEVLWLEGLFRPEVSTKLGFLTLFPYVLIFGTAIMVPVSWYFTGRRQGEPETRDTAIQTTPVTPPGETFFRRVPLALGRELYAIGAEDHYIRVHTERGNDLILHRFSDALTELDGLGGLQVHRSWWVARQGVDRVARRDRKTFLILKNGIEVPVSRSHMAAVRDAGWLA